MSVAGGQIGKPLVPISAFANVKGNPRKNAGAFGRARKSWASAELRKVEREQMREEWRLRRATDELNAFAAIRNQFATDTRIGTAFQPLVEHANETVVDQQQYLSDVTDDTHARIRALDPILRAELVDTVPFVLAPEVEELLKRPLSEWQAGFMFNVASLVAELEFEPWVDVIFLREDGLRILREFETSTGSLAVHGSQGIGKSTLLQLVALRSLVAHKPVDVFLGGHYTRIERVGKNRMRIQINPTVSKDTLLCYDAASGFEHTSGVHIGQRAFIVHPPWGNLNNTCKSRNMRSRFMVPPLLSELLAVAALAGISETECKSRIARYGPILRYVCDADMAEARIAAGMEAMLARGPRALVDFYKVAPVFYDVMLMVPANSESREHSTYFYRLASQRIADELLPRMAAVDNKGLIRLACGPKEHDSVYAQVFENRMIDLLGRAGNELEILTDGSDRIVRVARDAVVLERPEKLAYNVLYVSKSRIHKSWVAMMLDGNGETAFLLQMTVSHTPPIDLDELTAGFNFLRECGFNGEMRLACLLPPSVMPSGKKGDADAVRISGQFVQEKWCIVKINGNIQLWGG